MFGGAVVASLIVLGACPVLPPSCPWPGASSLHMAVSEVDILRGAETIVLGEVASVRMRDLPWAGPCAAITIAVEDCVTGECSADSVTTYMMAMPTAGMRRDEFPEVGRRYIFCLRWLSPLPGLVWGGYPGERYEVRDNHVVGVGLTVDRALEAIRALRSTRSPEVLIESCDLAVAGEVRRYVYTYSCPPEFGNELRQDDLQRMHDGYINPDACNFVEVAADHILKGPRGVGGVVRLVLPYFIGSGFDKPRFAEGQRVVVFACLADQGYWRLCAGVDSKLPIRQDGSVGSYASVDELAARAPN